MSGFGPTKDNDDDRGYTIKQPSEDHASICAISEPTEHAKDLHVKDKERELDEPYARRVPRLTQHRQLSIAEN